MAPTIPNEAKHSLNTNTFAAIYILRVNAVTGQRYINMLTGFS